MRADPSGPDACARVRIAVIADVRLYREGLAASLGSQQGLDVVGAAATANDAIGLVTSARADVAVLDMAARDSLEILRTLRAQAPEVRTIAFAVEESDGEILACVEAGVAGYVPCDGSLADLVRTIESVMRGELLCSPRVAAALLRRVAGLTPPSDAGAVLTAREREIVTLIDRGLSNKEIARELHIEVATVKNHVHSILEKLHVATRGLAAARLRGYGASGVRRAPLARLSAR